MNVEFGIQMRHRQCGIESSVPIAIAGTVLHRRLPSLRHLRSGNNNRRQRLRPGVGLRGDPAVDEFQQLRALLYSGLFHELRVELYAEACHGLSNELYGALDRATHHMFLVGLNETFRSRVGCDIRI